MNRFAKMLTLAVLAATLIGASVACNTMEGVGKDTKDAGQGIQNAADKNK